jgi:hypothetical protein
VCVCVCVCVRVCVCVCLVCVVWAQGAALIYRALSPTGPWIEIQEIFVRCPCWAIALIPGAGM